MTVVSRPVTPLLIAYATTSGDDTWATTATTMPASASNPSRRNGRNSRSTTRSDVRESSAIGLTDRIERERAPVLGELEQIVVRTIGDHSAAVEQDDAVGEADGLDPVGDHERCTAAHCFDEAA